MNSAHQWPAFSVNEQRRRTLGALPAQARRKYKRLLDGLDDATADENAWRNPQTWAGAAAVPAQRPDPLSTDALQMLDAKERAYREAAWADENAWRNPRP